MTWRVVIGQARGTYGIWVSKPGYDVFTAAESDLLLSSTAGERHLTHFAKGQVFVPAGQNRSISYPNFGTIPIIRYVTQIDGLDYIDRFTDFGWASEAVVNAGPDGAVFSNPNGLAAYFRYVVFARARGF